MKEKNNDGACLAEINVKEVRDSRENLEVVKLTIGTLSALIRLLSSKLTGRYEEGDRRFDAFDEAITRLDEATTALEALEGYENETISLCQSNE